MHLRFRTTLIILFILLCRTLLSQEMPLDTLTDKSFEYLRNGFQDHEENHEVSNIYANALVRKAIKEKDTFNLAYAYLYKSYIMDYDDALAYSDSIINLTVNFKNDEFPALGYMLKGYYKYANGDDKKALKLYLIGYDYALKNNNHSQQIEIKQFIGGLHYNSGNYKGALKIFKEQLLFFEENTNSQENFKMDYLLALDDLSKSYLRGKILDSALIYTKKGIDVSLNYKNDEMYNRFLLNSGATYYFVNDFSKSLDSLNKVEPKLSNNSLAVCLYYKAKIHQKDDIKKTIFYLRKVDSIYQKTQISFLELRDVYKIMLHYYTVSGSEKEQLESIKKLIKIDSIIDVDFNEINNNIIKDYEVPKLKHEKEKLELELVEKASKNNIVIIILASLLFLFALFMYRFYRNQRQYKKRFEKIINQKDLKKDNLRGSNIKISNSKLNISNNIVAHILKQLDEFESQYAFTRNDISLNKLSKDFNTNTAYLSKIINHYKNENFSNYLNSLRVDYVMEELKNNKVFRNYTISAISKEIGFNNPESFSKAFYKKTGIYPSFFIKELNRL